MSGNRRWVRQVERVTSRIRERGDRRNEGGDIGRRVERIGQSREGRVDAVEDGSFVRRRCRFIDARRDTLKPDNRRIAAFGRREVDQALRSMLRLALEGDVGIRAPENIEVLRGRQLRSAQQRPPTKGV